MPFRHAQLRFTLLNVAGNDLHLVRQLLVFGAQDAHAALATAVMFGHTDVAQLLQVHCRIMHYMSVVATR
jgi:hypothetical protein